MLKNGIEREQGQVLGRSQFLLSSAMTSYRALTFWQDQAAPACYRLLTAGISSAYLTWQVLRYLPQYLGTSQTKPHREGGTILSNLGKRQPGFNWSMAIRAEPRSRSLDSVTPAPAGSSRVVPSRAWQSITVRTRPRFETRLSPPSFCWFPATAKH